MAAAGKVRIGISGWRYGGWRGAFYPPELVQRRELEFASRQFSTIEINGTFYSLQRPESFDRWAAETPPDFVFAVKGSRYITHMLRLREVEGALANFFAQGLLHLGRKLGPVLWQFPPNFQFQPDRMEEFFRLLPRSCAQAAQMARNAKRAALRTDEPAGGNHPRISGRRLLRHAVEIRHESFVCASFIALLRRYGIGLVVADTVDWPLLFDVTADFVYCRLHGSEELYASGYDSHALDTWATRVARWARGDEVEDGQKARAKPAPKRTGRDVFVYFDNDRKVRAPADATQLAERVARLLEG